MPPPQLPAAESPGGGRDSSDCERVRRVLARAGFDTSSREGQGLRVWPTPEGVMVAWVAREVLRPTVRVHGHEEDPSRFTNLAGLHEALRTALAEVLRDAGLDVAPHGEHLLAVRPGAAPPGTGSPG